MNETGTSAPTPSGSMRISDQSRREALRKLNRRASPLGVIWQWAQTFAIAVIVFFFLRAFVIEAFKIPSGSMESTLMPGDFLLVDKLVYGVDIPFTSLRIPGWRTPQRGDVIVFQYPLEPAKTYVKRLVGVPGDTLSMREGALYRNGVEVREPYVVHSDSTGDPSNEQFRWQRTYMVRTAEAAPFSDRPTRNNWGPLVVPAGKYFALGDNRDNSEDSRYWGFVPSENVRGRPVVIYYSYAPDSTSAYGWLPGVRWQRLGARVR
jgi:signal peptidase I